MLQADPPPKAVKVTVSKRVPLVGDELIAYEEEQNRIKKEEALKASLIKAEELKASHGADSNTSDPMVIDTGNNLVAPEGVCCINYFGANLFEVFPFSSFSLSRRYNTFGIVFLLVNAFT